MKTFIVSISIILCAQLHAQESDPVRWHFSSKKVADNTYELHFTATINQPWHIYAQDNNEDITKPTTFSFNKNPVVLIQEKLKEVGTLKTEKVGTAGITVRYFENKVDFTQVIKLKANVKTNISGKVGYMACAGGVCLTPSEKIFNISVGL